MLGPTIAAQRNDVYCLHLLEVEEVEEIYDFYKLVARGVDRRLSKPGGSWKKENCRYH